MNAFKPNFDTALLIIGDPFAGSKNNKSTYNKLFSKAASLTRQKMPVIWAFDRTVLSARPGTLEGRHGFIGDQDLPGITFLVEGAGDIFKQERFGKWLQGTFNNGVDNIEIAALMASSTTLETAKSAQSEGISPRFISDALVDFDDKLMPNSPLAGDNLTRNGFSTVELNDVQPIRRRPGINSRINSVYLGRHAR